MANLPAVYIEKSGDLVGCYQCLTDTQTTEYSATELVESLKFKLSHAINILDCKIDLASPLDLTISGCCSSVSRHTASR